jgi:hypothetical protein
MWKSRPQLHCPIFWRAVLPPPIISIESFRHRKLRQTRLPTTSRRPVLLSTCAVPLTALSKISAEFVLLLAPVGPG